MYPINIMYPCPYRSLTKPHPAKMSNDTFIDAGDKTKQTEWGQKHLKCKLQSTWTTITRPHCYSMTLKKLSSSFSWQQTSGNIIMRLSLTSLSFLLDQRTTQVRSSPDTDDQLIISKYNFEIVCDFAFGGQTENYSSDFQIWLTKPVLTEWNANEAVESMNFWKIHLLVMGIVSGEETLSKITWDRLKWLTHAIPDEY